jgi:hypothetical protein
MKMLRLICLGIIALASCAVSLRAAAVDVIPASEFLQYSEVYRLAIPAPSPGWNLAGNFLAGSQGYSINNAASIPQGSFSRVAYFLELSGGTATNTPNGYVWVSFDAADFTDRADRIGIPNTFSGAFFQQNISNMTVISNVPGVLNGTGITTGNIEFWPSNYTAGNSRSVNNASSSAFDFGDGGAGLSAGHASMQIHNYDLDGTGPGTTGQTLFAYNAWGANRTSELGIGNNPNTAQAPDYTNAGNAAGYTTRTLQVFIAPITSIPEPGTIGLWSLGGIVLVMGRRRLLGTN